MDAERWRQIEDLYHSALSRPPEGRAAFLADVCLGDSDLQQRVQSLLAANEQAGSFLESPAFDDASTLNAPLPVQIGSYKILHQLGAGGMGEVYRAHDAKLGRDVAIKTLARAFAADPERVSRLRREARTLAALNHPNLAAIYDLLEADGACYLVLELVEGETLCGPLPLDKALDCARQIAEGLHAAHSKGIVHRDLKPGNVKVTPEGRVKVLDFGLAKAIWGSDDRHRVSELSTATGTNTLTGQVLGTPSYMSPEQARGETIDKRTDLWAFGCLVYELLTGKRVFEGATIAETVALVLESDPDWSALPPKTPAKIRELLRGCLLKDPSQRPADIRSAAQIIESVIASISGVHLQSIAQPSSLGRWTRYVAGGAIAAAIVAGIALVDWPRKAAALSQQDTILLADFANQTGDPVFDQTLREALAIQLGQSPYLNFLPESGVRETLQHMNRSGDTRLTPPVAREICQRQGLKAFVTGSIAPLGSKYIVTLEADRGDTGDTLDRAQVEAARKEDVLGALADAASEFRRRVGESLRSVKRFDAPVEQATTSSLEALHAFSMGEEKWAAGKSDEALLFYRRAVELDPQFALAHGRLATMYHNTLEYRKAAEEQKKAFELRGRTTERERYYIEVSYFRDTTGEAEKWLESARLWAETYPRDYRAHTMLAYAALTLGNEEESVQEARRAIALNPRYPSGYDLVSESLTVLNRGAEARSVLQQAIAILPQVPNFHLRRFVVAAADDDEAEMARQLAWSETSPFGYWVVWGQAHLQFSRGQPARADESFRHGVEMAGEREVADWHRAADLLGNALLGRCAKVRSSPDQLSRRSDDFEVVWRAGTALALCGRTREAESLAEAASRSRPKGTVVNSVGVPLIRGAAALRAGRSAEAIDILRPAAGNLSRNAELMPNLIRGWAYLAQHDGRKALADFDTILAHRYRCRFLPEYALAQLGAARAAALAGERALSRQRYLEFFESWKDAEPDLPALAEAKKEFAALH